MFIVLEKVNIVPKGNRIIFIQQSPRSIIFVLTREFSILELHHYCIIRHVLAYHHPADSSMLIKQSHSLLSPVTTAAKNLPRFTGLRGLDGMNSQLVRNVPQLLDGLQFRFMIVRHFFIRVRACL